MNILIICDAQNDNLKGRYAFPNAAVYLEKIKRKAAGFTGSLVFTMRTFPKYAFEDENGALQEETYCMEGTEGWEICDDFLDAAYGTVSREEESCSGGCCGEAECSCDTEESFVLPVEHADHGSFALAAELQKLHKLSAIENIELAGFGAEDVILSNAVILHTAFPFANMVVDADYCAARKQSSKHAALRALKAAGISVIET